MAARRGNRPTQGAHTRLAVPSAGSVGGGGRSSRRPAAADAPDLSDALLDWLQRMQYRPSGKYAGVGLPSKEALRALTAKEPWAWQWLLDNFRPPAEVQAMVATVRADSGGSVTAKEMERHAANEQVLSLQGKKAELESAVAQAVLQVEKLGADLTSVDMETRRLEARMDQASMRSALSAAHQGAVGVTSQAIEALAANIDAILDRRCSESVSSGKASSERSSSKISAPETLAYARRLEAAANEVLEACQEAVVRTADDGPGIKDAFVQAKLQVGQVLSGLKEPSHSGPRSAMILQAPQVLLEETVKAATSASHELEAATASLDLAADAASLSLSLEDDTDGAGGEATSSGNSPLRLEVAQDGHDNAAPQPAKAVFGDLDRWASDSPSAEATEDGSSDDEDHGSTPARLSAAKARIQSSSLPSSHPLGSATADYTSSTFQLLDDGFEAGLVPGHRVPASKGQVGRRSAGRRARWRRRAQAQHTLFLQLSGALPSPKSGTLTVPHTKGEPSMLPRVNTLLSEFRSAHVARFHRIQRKLRLLRSVEEALSSLPTDANPGKDSPGNLQRLLWRSAELRAAVAQAEDHLDRLSFTLQLRQETMEEVRSQTKKLHQLKAAITSKTNIMKWYIRANHAAVSEMLLMQRSLQQQADRQIRMVFQDLPDRVKGMASLHLADWSAHLSVCPRTVLRVGSISTRSTARPLVEDLCIHHARDPSPALQELSIASRFPPYGSVDSFFAKIVAARTESAVLEALLDDSCLASSSAEQLPSVRPDSEVGGPALERLKSKVQAVLEEKRTVWAPAVGAYLSGKRAEFRTHQAASTKALKEWWEQPAFQVPGWVTLPVSTASGTERSPEGDGRTLASWQTEWAELSHRLRQIRSTTH